MAINILTVDGNRVRDYIHVVDLTIGHVKVLEKIMNTTGVEVYNLGTGREYSFPELVSAFEKVISIKILYKIVDRRLDDIAICYVDPTKTKEELGWVATREIEEMCRDAWRWQSNNPNGYMKACYGCMIKVKEFL